MFLILRGIRQFLNIRHNRKILREEENALEDKDLPYPDNGTERTNWGKSSAWLFSFEPLLLTALIQAMPFCTVVSSSK